MLEIIFVIQFLLVIILYSCFCNYMEQCQELTTEGKDCTMDCLWSLPTPLGYGRGLFCIQKNNCGDLPFHVFSLRSH